MSKTDDVPSVDGPWTIKSIPPDARAQALAAAKRAKRTVGDWLAEAIRARVESERESAFDSGVLQVFAPRPDAALLSLDDIARIVEIAGRVAELRGTKMPRRIAGRINALLAMQLGVAARNGNPGRMADLPGLQYGQR